MINIKRLLVFGFVFVSFFSVDEVKAQKINQFDSNKKRTGIWKKYYPNKTIRYEGEFKNGKEVGVFKFYKQSQSRFPVITKTYRENNDTITVNFFTSKGKLQSKGFFIDRTRVGAWKYYFPDGKLMSEEFYNNGKLEGKLVNYYPNGKPTEITEYKNGIKNGLSQKYSSDGVLIEEVRFENGQLNGLAKYFELNGNLKETGIYKDNKRFGKWEFYLDGEVADEKDIEKKKKFKKKGK